MKQGNPRRNRTGSCNDTQALVALGIRLSPKDCLDSLRCRKFSPSNRSAWVSDGTQGRITLVSITSVVLSHERVFSGLGASFLLSNCLCKLRPINFGFWIATESALKSKITWRCAALNFSSLWTFSTKAKLPSARLVPHLAGGLCGY